MNKWRLGVFLPLTLLVALSIAGSAWAQGSQELPADRQEAAKIVRERINRRLTIEERFASARQAASTATVSPQQVSSTRPNYFGKTPYWTNSPPLRKFVDLLPGLNATNANNLGQFIPVAVPDTTTYPGCDYYVIELRQYRERMHSDLPLTRLRGYVQVRNGVDVAPPHYLGPMILAQKNRPVRVKFINKLPTGEGGNLFLPVDTTTMGAGEGPIMGESYTQNRAAIHLHGGLTPWISDGTPHQWITPQGEMTMYPKGVSVQNVPDMPDPGEGATTFFYSNQQSARLMFYHDHAYGITRLNVYAGEAAPYMLQDETEKQLITDGIIPGDQIPLVIQDKTFVPQAGPLKATDPLWDTTKWGGYGNLWFPHVYMPNQNPNAPDGANPMGRLDYGPWFWPPWPAKFPPYVDGGGREQPNLPDISSVMEASMDTPVVNGTAYPICRVSRKPYRFRILNAANDRHFNLGLYYAKSNTPDTVDPGTGLPTLQTNSGEIPTLPAVNSLTWPDWWGQPDDRPGGLPDPAAIGPPIIQIGTEGGFLPAPVVIPSTPVGFDLDTRSITLNLIKEHGLWLAPAERADVIIDFSQVPEGSRLILYNDCPSPAPLPDRRVDYYTGDPDMREIGGAAPTVAGYGPNTRTIMQFEVSGPQGPLFDLARLQAEFASTPTKQGVFARSQDPIIVPQEWYNSAYNRTFPNGRDAYVRLHDTSFTFTPRGSASRLTIPLTPKAIAEEFEDTYGRMSAFLGVEVPFTNGWNQTTIFFKYLDPLTEVVNANMVPLSPVAGDGTQIWKITHNGIDTHPIHFHLFNVQIVNRVDWAGIVIPPDPNELGWKETVRMSAFQDTIVALRPVAPSLPFGVPDSIRPLDPTMPLGTTGQFTGVDPSGNPIDVVNKLVNFGHEFVWHCHMLGHEEMDMMRPVKINVGRLLPPPPGLTGRRYATPARVVLNWTDGTPAATSWGNPANEIGFEIMRDPGDGTFVKIGTALANQTRYIDTTMAPGVRYRYRIVAYNAVGKSRSNIINPPVP